MAYATPEELARALWGPKKPVTPEEEPRLQACLDAAAAEIDHDLARTTEIDPSGDLFALANRVNILRGVEWARANDAAFGVLQFPESEPLAAPTIGFRRHADSLTPLKERWGLA